MDHTAGITVNQIQNCAGGANPDASAPLIPAILCTLGTVTVPAAASVYNEFALKKHMDTSVHLQVCWRANERGCLGVYGMC